MCLLVALFLSFLAIAESQVKCRNTSLAVLGEDVILTCEFQSNLHVLQVTWQKKREEETQNMATHSEMYGISIAKLFESHVLVINHSSGSSSIKISKLEKEDEGCYICLFNAYPNGAFKGEVCLTNLCLPPDSDSTKTLRLNKPSIGGINKEPEMHKDKQHHSLVWILMIITGGIVMLMVTVLVILVNYKARRQ
ncbi:nectin-1-like isoform X2 [Pyxicephalus adspersus]|uniref:nectin-1-like isoform X2 n=1 Tax=Pyxicephalus adspersus TaxID=30357 RepID=UPI003B5A487F